MENGHASAYNGKSNFYSNMKEISDEKEKKIGSCIHFEACLISKVNPYIGPSLSPSSVFLVFRAEEKVRTTFNFNPGLYDILFSSISQFVFTI